MLEVFRKYEKKTLKWENELLTKTQKKVFLMRKMSKIQKKLWLSWEKKYRKVFEKYNWTSIIRFFCYVSWVCVYVPRVMVWTTHSIQCLAASSSDLHVAHVCHLSHLNWIPIHFCVINIRTSCMYDALQTLHKKHVHITRACFCLCHDAHSVMKIVIDMWHPRRIYLYYVCLSCQRNASCNCVLLLFLFFVQFFITFYAALLFLLLCCFF